VRFQDASPDARAVVYAGIQADPLVARASALLADATHDQRILARAVMNGMSTSPTNWQAMFPSLFGVNAPSDGPERARTEAILAASLEVAERGEQIRSQVRGALVESVTELLVRRRPGLASAALAAVRRERRILFDGVRAEIHPYDVTIETPGASEAIDCKWGARGINADVLHQLDDARTHAADEDEVLTATIVVFDAERSCAVRLDRQTAPHDATRLISLETLDQLAGR